VESQIIFTCNVCGARNQVAEFATEPASCACGSNVRVRALLHLLSMELFSRSLTAIDFPKLKSIRGLGMTDKPGYAAILAEKFDYTNTFYDRTPRFDFTEPHAGLYGTYDFILSADVLEHVAPPVARAFENARKLLRPGGTLATFCCSHHVDAATFQDVILSAAYDTRRILRRVATYSQGPDHPIIPMIPETEYLKGFALEVVR